MDRLSELPESLIHHILSFLPIRDVVSTSLLSKRWENVWTTLPCLNFSGIVTSFEASDSNRVRNFVNRALLFWKGNKLLKFIIDIPHSFDKSLAGDMDLWVRFAVENRVEELNLSFFYVPQEDFDWEDAVLGTWNQLKSLSIDGFYFSERLINRILLGAPQLEEFELRLIENNENLNIQSTSLKKLKINKYLCLDDDQPTLDTVLRICCPNLETLEISGLLYSKCLFTNVSPLTDATIDLYDTERYDARGIKLLGETMRHLFSTFQHVGRLTLSSSSIQVIGRSLNKKLLPPLPNVVFLKLVVYWPELIEMVHLLEIFPNLKMLIIKDYSPVCSPDINEETFLECETNVSKSFLLQLKAVEITSNFFESSILRYIKFLLRHGCMLEKLVIWADRSVSGDQARLFEVTERLLSMPRSSPTAEVIFKTKLIE